VDGGGGGGITGEGEGDGAGSTGGSPVVEAAGVAGWPQEPQNRPPASRGVPQLVQNLLAAISVP
jgi:hypothetical protein